MNASLQYVMLRGEGISFDYPFGQCRKPEFVPKLRVWRSDVLDDFSGKMTDFICTDRISIFADYTQPAHQVLFVRCPLITEFACRHV